MCVCVCYSNNRSAYYLNPFIQCLFIWIERFEKQSIAKNGEDSFYDNVDSDFQYIDDKVKKERARAVIKQEIKDCLDPNMKVLRNMIFSEFVRTLQTTSDSGGAIVAVKDELLGNKEDFGRRMAKAANDAISTGGGGDTRGEGEVQDYKKAKNCKTWRNFVQAVVSIAKLDKSDVIALGNDMVST